MRRYETITDEQIADLDRRGMRDAAIIAGMRAEALGRYASPPFWWSREKKAD